MKTTYHGPYLAQDAFGLPIPTDCPDYRRAAGGGLRRAVESQIETLIAFLDFIDIDCDLEPANDDESGHDEEAIDGRPVWINACGGVVLL